jgi:hypothetical protein
MGLRGLFRKNRHRQSGLQNLNRHQSNHITRRARCVLSHVFEQIAYDVAVVAGDSFYGSDPIFLDEEFALMISTSERRLR